MPLLITIVPMCLSSAIFGIFRNVGFGIKYILLNLLVFLISSIVITTVYFYIRRKLYRTTYQAYEGIWIQYIPEFKRQISICRLTYKEGSFHFDGTNFYNDGKNYVSFHSYMVIENGPDSFFFITDATKKYGDDVNIHGFGIISDLSNTPLGIHEANGYFFDTSSANGDSDEKALQRTYLCKFDKDYVDYFSRRGLNRRFPMDLNRLTDEKIFMLVSPYIHDYYRDRIEAGLRQ